MQTDLTFGKTLHCFRNQSLIIYFERDYNAEINEIIRSNFNQLVEISGSENIDFCYMPLLPVDDKFQSVISYNHPYLKTKIKDIDIQQIYDLLISKQTTLMHESGLLLLTENHEFNESVFTGTGTDFLNTFQNAVAHFAGKIQSGIGINLQPTIPHFNINYEVASEPANEYSQHTPGKRDTSKADENFENDAFRLADEIRERILLLKEYGSLSLIVDLIKEVLNESQKLSSICITSDYRIFLKDYGMLEVVMTPLPKSVFLLFLRYPEGILFKELIDYHDELLSIYRSITKFDDIDRTKESIRALTDPFNGSINEKCSRIRAAFLEVISDQLAQNYYITGKRGEPKKIKLDRNLVEFK